MKGFKDKSGKFRPTENKKGIHMSRDQTAKMEGIRMKRTTQLNHKKWGFDLTKFKPNGFEKVLSKLGILEGSVTDDMGTLLDGTPYRRGFIWSGEGIEITTMNNPITGEYNNPKHRGNEKDYASYIGIEGVPEQVNKAVKLIKEHNDFIKDESPNQRMFI